MTHEEQLVARRLLEISKSDPIMDLAHYAVNLGLTERDVVRILRNCDPSIPDPLKSRLHNCVRDALNARKTKGE